MTFDRRVRVRVGGLAAVLVATAVLGTLLQTSLSPSAPSPGSATAPAVDVVAPVPAAVTVTPGGFTPPEPRRASARSAT